MKTVAKPAEPENIAFTMTITGTLKEFASLEAAITAHQKEKWKPELHELLDQISNLTYQAKKHFSVTASET